MTGDIFEVTVNIACPDSPASFSLAYRETEPNDSFTFATEALCVAWEEQVSAALKAFLSQDFLVVSIECYKRFNIKEPMFRHQVPVQVGARPGPGLPANNALVVSLAQGENPSPSNGRIFLPGFAEADVNVDVISAAMKLLVVTFGETLLTGLNEPSPGNGQWELGVISQKILRVPDAPPAWADAFAPVQAISCSPIMHQQKRRSTQIVGASIAP